MSMQLDSPSEFLGHTKGTVLHVMIMKYPALIFELLSCVGSENLGHVNIHSVMAAYYSYKQGTDANKRSVTLPLPPPPLPSKCNSRRQDV